MDSDILNAENESDALVLASDDCGDGRRVVFGGIHWFYRRIVYTILS